MLIVFPWPAANCGHKKTAGAVKVKLIKINRLKQVYPPEL
ncbi:hypothetical protein AB28_3043 [Raoultella ornithinolytica 2-156-04_S1_C2]|nr:hypothetical protein AB00_3036 [Raoultella ornithinolytica 2-156-04_S1_C1]KDX13121.1 hypothetical protein AB28_3043 [Raoultella ornithinolytica 2-156-04_S1_C2]